MQVNPRKILLFLTPFVLPVIAGMTPARARAAEPTPADLLKKAGIASTPQLRGQMDTTGFAPTAAAMDAVRDRSLEAARSRESQLREEKVLDGGTAFALAACPHDDYAYAGRLYALVLKHIRAPRVIVFGVFHKARVFDCRDKLVFDAFPAWRGPYGPIPVSPLRAELLQRLPQTDRVVSNDMHAVEHSVEAIVYFLQAFRRDVEIVPVLVPHMGWETLDGLAGRFSDALSAVMKAKGWVMGRDVALVCSVDGVHYGDAHWGPSHYCPFGADLEGYRRAAAQDREIAMTLAGPLDPEKARRFMQRCVDPADVTRYRVTWCGRFSVPFGMVTAARVRESLGLPPLSGAILDCGTSVSEAGIDVSDIPGMGVTAPANFHHFVGYTAIGWW
ncbi:MAG: AmmeMemoRadiSam system protein B [Acidobacteria bacterium]|nr:AmmeMemoRadiSam system protein B [Acidobacteriota bacterium]